METDTFREKLLAEKKVIEDQLDKLGVRNPDNPEDWDPVPEPPPKAQADKNEMADRLEDFEERRSTEVSLELRLGNIRKALAKIEEGTYGRCEKGDHEIEHERLLANPAATTCIKHAE